MFANSCSRSREKQLMHASFRSLNWVIHAFFWPVDWVFHASFQPVDWVIYASFWPVDWVIYASLWPLNWDWVNAHLAQMCFSHCLVDTSTGQSFTTCPKTSKDGRSPLLL